ncbi:Uncharacterised protein [Serratia fonticola]|nr:Uncharacterised protein [Serratia fonticola]CAI1824240.1 Uncharacterised protein [Serratia fonticola]CAI2031453.1 Uncharacterised protein [Serratia fonticola]CAI2476046.1 Uncharacterised protein [Serratia fonticola]
MRKYRLPDSRQDGISPTGRGDRSSSLITLCNTLSFFFLIPYVARKFGDTHWIGGRSSLLRLSIYLQKSWG